MMRLAFVIGVSACAIHPPPDEPGPPVIWTTPSVRRDCDVRCGGAPEPYLSRCMNDREQHEPVPLRCGHARLVASQESSLGERVAITIGIAGIVVVSLLAAGVIGPSP